MGPSTVVLDPGEKVLFRDAILIAVSLSIINEKLPEYHRGYNNNNNNKNCLEEKNTEHHFTQEHL